MIMLIFKQNNFVWHVLLNNNKMKGESKATLKQKDLSLIASLYRYWEQYKIPAIFYHYTLSILPLKQKHQQLAFMNKEIKLMQLSSHPYHVITDLITSREQSLKIILNNAEVLIRAGNDSPSPTESDYEREYSIVSQHQQKGKMNVGSKRFIQLINNIKIFRKMTIEVVYKVYGWAKQLHQNEYKGVIQFMYQHQDYLQKISQDTSQVVSKNEILFENNPLLIMKKEHQKTQYALIYQYLKITQQEAIKIHQILSIITTHHAILENKRLLGMFKHSDSRKHMIAANSFQKIYSTLTKNNLPPQAQLKNELVLKNHKNFVNPQNFSEKGRSSLYLEKPMSLKDNGRSKSQAIIHQLNMNQPSNQFLKDSSVRQQVADYQLSFQFQTNIQKENIYRYLRNNIFKNLVVDPNRLQTMAKTILQLKDCISLIKIKAGELLVSWLAVIFIPKDQFFRRVANIIYLQTFMKFPGFQRQLFKKMTDLGYGIIKKDGRIIYEQSSLPVKAYHLISIEWQVKSSKKEKIKKIIKQHQQLKNSRLLKYYSYSNETKYHRYCLHQQSSCKVTFKFDQVSRLGINGKTYLRVKCDKIEKKGEIWKIEQSLNELHLVIATNLQAIETYQKNNGVSVEQISQSMVQANEKMYLCLPETKKIKKYVDSKENQVICEKAGIDSSTAETLSILHEKKELSKLLIMDEEVVMGLVCSNQQDYGKTVAVIIIN